MSVPAIPISLIVAYNGDYFSNEITIAAGDDTHTGFKLYRDDGGGWTQIDQFNTTELNYTDYRGGAGDTGKPWGVTAFNADGESARLEINTVVPDFSIDQYFATRFPGSNTIEVQWSWSSWGGPVPNLYFFAASEYDASSGYWTELGQVPASEGIAVLNDPPIVGIPEAETWIVQVHGEWQQTPLAEITLPPVLGHQTHPLTNITALVSNLNRVWIDFDPASWEAEPGFFYRFTFQHGAESPIVLDRGWGVLTNGARRELLDEVIGITWSNAAEWTCTIQGMSDWGAGDATAPFALVQEANAELLSFDMDDTAQISWVFSDWQNAQPLEVETRIDGGPWRPTFVTDKTRSNDELYGDRCIIGDDWSGGLLGHAHFHWPFDGQHHTVEARARIQGSADEWRYGPARSIPLRSLYVPELIPGSTPFQGETGPVDLPMPTFMVRRPDYYERYTLDVSSDGGPFLPFADLPGSVTARIGTAWNDTVARLPESLQDGGSHTLNFRLNVIQNGVATFGYPLPPLTVVIPQSAALIPQAPDWTIDTREENGTLVFTVAANASNPHGTAFQFDMDGTPVTPFELPDADPNRKTFRLPLPPADGLFRLITCVIAIHSTCTGKSKTRNSVVSYRQKKPKLLPPVTLNAELQRQADGAVPDRVRLTWPAGQLVQLIAQLGTAVFSLGYADSTESEAIIEDTRAHLPKSGALYPVRFGIRAYHRAADVGAARLTDTVSIRAHPAPRDSPDLATDVDLLDSAVLAWITDRIALSFSAVPEAMRNLIVASAIKATKTRIKAAVATGGGTMLDNFGVFAAKWNKDRFDSRGNLVAAERGLTFVPSPGFVEGVKAGAVLTDTEVEALP